MAIDSPQTLVQQLGNERQRFLDIAGQVSETIGTEFFSMLVRELRRALGAERVYVCEFVGRQTERARTLASCGVGDRMETVEFLMVGSPDAEVVLCHPCIYSRRVQEIFPADHRLRDAKAEAWVGVPLSNAEGRASGLIAALSAGLWATTVNSYS